MAIIGYAALSVEKKSLTASDARNLEQSVMATRSRRRPPRHLPPIKQNRRQGHGICCQSALLQSSQRHPYPSPSLFKMSFKNATFIYSITRRPSSFQAALGRNCGVVWSLKPVTMSLVSYTVQLHYQPYPRHSSWEVR